MGLHLQREIEHLKKQLLSLCGLVEEQVQLSVRAYVERDEEMAQEVEQRDVEIDHQEVEVEEECLKVLALHQPVATDLRFIVAALKINNDLERIGDMAVNIAHKVVSICSLPPVHVSIDLEAMWHKTQSMLQDAVDALVNVDAQQAADVCARDDEVDQLKREVKQAVLAAIRQDPANTDTLLSIMAVSRNLERVADHATNIAEDVIYMVQAKIIRHGVDPSLLSEPR